MTIINGVLPLDTLFIHGNLASNRWWEPTIEVLKSKASGKFHEGRAILSEWRGCGSAKRPQDESELNIKILAQDYIDLLRNLNIKKACVVGHSTGGVIALQAMILAPELFHRAVFLDSVGPKGVKLAPEMIDAFSKMRVDFEFCKAVMSATIKNADVFGTFFNGIATDAFSIAPTNWMGVPKALANIDLTSQIGQVQQPILVLHGDEDPILPFAGSQEMAAQLPAGKFELLKGFGHSPNVENPDLFVSKMYSFLFEEK